MISSSLHPGDFLAVLAVLSVVACVGLILLIWKRRELVSLLKRWDGAEFWLAFVEGLGAFSAGAVAAAFKVWELDAWRQHPVRTPYAFRFAVGMTFLVIYAKWARDRVKERDKEKVPKVQELPGANRIGFYGMGRSGSGALLEVRMHYSLRLHHVELLKG